MDALARSLALSPELFPQALDVRSDSVAFIRLGKADYNSASFLDDRILSPQTLRRTLPWNEVLPAVAHAGLEERCEFIFHIGHVGSTLLSRLLGGLPSVLALREPAILRTMAQIRGEPAFERQVWGEDGFELRLGALLKLWSRTFEPGGRAVVKATSFVSELAAELLARPSEPRALLMYVLPESYIATILGGANAPQEARMLAPDRSKRLQRRLGTDIAATSIGEIVAMSWACEMTALLNAKAMAGERALLLDFDAFLTQPALLLAQAALHLGIPACEPDIRHAIDGPEMRRYSKAPEYAYDAALRRDVLNQARAISGPEIRRGLLWLDALAGKNSAMAQALELTR
jgi:hypothetical protein